MCHKFGLCAIQPKTLESKFHCFHTTTIILISSYLALKQRRELRNRSFGKSKLPKMDQKFD